MKVFIDGAEVEVLNDIRVVYDVETSEGKGELVVVANHEGLVYDLYDASGEEVVETSYDFASDLVERLEGE